MKQLTIGLIALALIFLYACGNSDKEISIVEKNFENEVPLMGNLEFSFDKDVVEDIELNIWDTLEYIKFDPELKGRFLWSSKNTLVFSPIRQLQPSTEYKGKFTSDFLKGKEYSLNEDEFSFHTPYLSVQTINGYWAEVKENSGDAYIHFSVIFNYAVKPNELAELLKVEIENKEVDFTLESNEVSDVVTVYVPGIKPEDKVYPASLTIASGLNAAYGNIATKEPVQNDLEITSPFKLLINDFQTNHNGSEGTIQVFTSQRVDDKMLRGYLTVSPRVDFDLEINDMDFIIKSTEFDVSQKYELFIEKGLKGKLGGSLKYDFEQDISFGKLKPSIKFPDKKSIYLSGRGSKNIEVSIVNVPKVKVKITKVYENNIISFLGNRYYSYYDDYYEDYYDDYYYDNYSSQASNLGDVVYEEEVWTKDLEKNNRNKLITLDFKDKIPEYKGLYVVSVESTEDYWMKATKVLSISDIGLIVKDGKNSISVFANSIKDATPLEGVELHFIGNNNQVTGSAKTDANGVAVFDAGKLPADGFNVKLVTAVKGGDFNYILYNQSRVNTSKFEVGGKYENNSGYDAFLYGDRDIYRPGETIYITGIIRDFSWNVPGKIPLKIMLLTPDGKTYKTHRKTLNNHGSFETSFELPASAMTGSYTVQVYTSTDVLVSTKWIKVEEFMPDRINVTVTLDKELAKPREDIAVSVNAVNFFGPPAANRNYEVEQSVMRKYFYPKKNKGYNYSLQGIDTYFKRTLREGKTDADGNTTEIFNVPSHYAHMGMLQADYFVTVFDETGRPVNRRKTIDIQTQDVFFGIQYDFNYYKTGQLVKVPIIAVDREGNALNNAKAEVTLIKHEYKTVLNKSGSYFRYRSEHEEIVLERKELEISGENASYSFTPELSGKYELRISEPGVNSYVANTFYCYGYGRTSFSSFKVNNEGTIDIELDKEKYIAGDVAKVIMKTPFTGKVLVTVESDKVMKHFYQETDKRAVAFDLEITPDMVPNVYITATLFKPHQKTDLPFTVAHGIVPVLVEDPDNKLPLEIEAAKQSRSRTKQTIKVHSKPNSAVTIAVVDEGILQVTGFKTPDPYGYFYGKRALAVNSYDIYPYLFPELISSIAGGGGPSMEKRVNPMQNKRVKLLAFWSGILETDGGGDAEFEIDIPQFSGDLIIMAVNYKGKAFASDFTNMKVADPLVISTALPRFLSPRDTIEVPVSVSNTTKNKTDCKVKLEVEGPVRVLGSSKQSVKIQPNSEGQVLFKAVAQPELGEAKFIITADGAGETFLNETDITVRPASPLIKYNGSGVVKAGNTQSISMDIGSFIPASVDNKLIVSKSPLIQFTDDLEYLVRYPYGCVEQTVSSAFPQLYYSDIVMDVFNAEGNKEVPAHNVRAAINKLMLMQLYNGGLTYWPQNGTESWWGTVYAAHFIIEAQKAGYDVDQSMLDKMMDYMKMKLKTKEVVSYYYNG
ncbi:MAG: hypothetical protein C0594_03390, partial [Marinilabiliales bacterium]